MIDFIESVPGPTFLVVFTVATLVLFFIGRFWSSDDTMRFRVPSLTEFDPLAIATMRGTESAIRTVVFSLWSNDHLESRNTGRSTEMQATHSSQNVSGQLEILVLDFFKSFRKTSDLFKDKRFMNKANEILDPYYARLEKSHLIRDRDQKSHAWKVAWIILGAILLLGVSKILLGISNDRPIFFLVVLLILAVIFCFVVIKPNQKVSNLGKKYLDALQSHFEWLQNSMKTGKVPDGINPALPVAIFGTAFLANTLFYSSYNQAFSKSNYWGGGCGGCGGGGGCSGSGCGGGGCGGGCGGCGG